tara:strand:+ start:855 stop:1073 length:219 start_codon:yes stop_codon:yes gene_type:complete
MIIVIFIVMFQIKNMKEIRKRLLDFLVKEVKDSKEQINTTDIILDFLKNEFHEEDEIERMVEELFVDKYIKN